MHKTVLAVLKEQIVTESVLHTTLIEVMTMQIMYGLVGCSSTCQCLQWELRSHWQAEVRNLKVNDLVVLAEDNIPRGQWNLGRILEVYPSVDGRVRSVKIKTARGEYCRPAAKIALLEEGHVESWVVPTQRGRCIILCVFLSWFTLYVYLWIPCIYCCNALCPMIIVWTIYVFHLNYYVFNRLNCANCCYSVLWWVCFYIVCLVVLYTSKLWITPNNMCFHSVSLYMFFL